MESKKKLIGGTGVEFGQLFKSRVVQGCMVGAPTNASTQATGTGASDYNLDITAGIVTIAGAVSELAVQADLDIDSATTGNAILALNEARVYDIVIYKSLGDGVVYQRTFKSAIAATLALVVPPTDAEIEALLAVGTDWMRIGRTTVERDGDTSISQTYSNVVRNLMIPGTIHYGWS